MNVNEIALRRWGSRQGIYISKEILEELSIQDLENVKFKVSISDNQLILKPIVEKSPFLQLFEGFEGVMELEPYDWGDFDIPVGKEFPKWICNFIKAAKTI